MDVWIINQSKLRAALVLFAAISMFGFEARAAESFIPYHQERILPSANTLKLKAKWRPVLSKSHQELMQLEQGRLKPLISYLRTLSAEAQIHYINRWFNKRMVYRRDRKGYDKWQSIGESVFRRAGDCEDYSIAKYAMLRYLGHDTNNLMLVGGVSRSAEKHIVLYVRHGSKVLALDMARDVITSVEHAFGFNPVFGFREQVTQLYLYKRKYLPIRPRKSDRVASFH